MKNDRYQELMSEYLDGELQEREEKIVFVHLGTCSACREFFRNSLELRSQLLKTRLSAPQRLDSRLGIEKPKAVRPEEQDLLVLAWQKKVPLPVAASISLILLLGALLLSTLAPETGYDIHPDSQYFRTYPE